MNFAELKKLVEETSLDAGAPSVPPAAGPPRDVAKIASDLAGDIQECWPQYWNHLWAKVEEAGGDAAAQEMSREEKLNFADSLAGGDFDECLNNDVWHAKELVVAMLGFLLRDPFVLMEAGQWLTEKMFVWLYKEAPSTVYTQKQLAELLQRRIVHILKYSKSKTWGALFRQAPSLAGPLAAAGRQGARGAVTAAARKGGAKAAESLSKRALATLANPLVAGVTGVVDVGIMAADIASPQALRAGAYSSMLMKDLIAAHRMMYLDRKRLLKQLDVNEADERPLEWVSNHDLSVFIEELEFILEGSDRRYLVYAPKKEASVGDEETEFFGVISTAEYTEPDAQNFIKAKRLFSRISKTSLVLFNKAMNRGWNPEDDDAENTKILEDEAARLELDVIQDHLAYFQIFRTQARKAVQDNGTVNLMAPWIKSKKKIVLIDESLSFGEKKEINIVEYTIGKDTETDESTAYDTVSLATLWGGYEGMPQRNELAYWMKKNYFSLLKTLRNARKEKKQR